MTLKNVFDQDYFSIDGKQYTDGGGSGAGSLRSSAIKDSHVRYSKSALEGFSSGGGAGGGAGGGSGGVIQL